MTTHTKPEDRPRASPRTPRGALLGADHPDALYRAAGSVAPGAGAMRFPCPSCRRGTERVIRVRPAPNSGWVGVCAICAASVLSTRPGSVVGGLVRPVRRRRRAG